jgi:hypothetical protein
MKTKLSFWRYFPILCLALALTLSIGCKSEPSGSTDTASPAANTITSNGQTMALATTYEGTATTYTRRGNDPFSIGYYVKDGMVIGENSLLADEDASASAFDLDIVANGEAFSAVIATGKGSDITLTGTVTATDSGDGKLASDFSGIGAQVIAHDHAKVTINDMTFDTKGFLRAAFIADEYGQVLVKNTTVKALGANPLTEAYDEYVNSADQNIMLSPPWVLGIMGGIRGGNMLGDYATLSVIDSSISTGGWAVLSTDACKNPMMNVVDTTMEILPESEGGMSSGNFPYSSKYGTGYGTYLIGGAVQNFYGVAFKGLTYAGIYTGGEGTYKSSTGDITLKDAEGNVIETVKGKGNPTTIDAVWGFMTHGQGTLNVVDGTVVNAEEAVFLHKSGDVRFNADNATLNSNSGILLQMIDNDDRTVGGSMAAFNTEFNEKAGWPSENGSVTEPGAAAAGGMGGRGEMAEGGMPEGGGPGGDMGGREGGMPEGGGRGGDMGGREGGMPEGGGPDGGMEGGREGMPGGPGEGGGGMPSGSSGAKLILTNGDYKGDVFNGSGYYTQSGNTLDVSVGKGATLTGAISLTETRHVDENGEQNTHFTINEYYYLGHVENRNYRNETAEISVVLKDGGVWNVTGESLISSLQLDGGVVNNAKMTVDGKATPIEAGKTYTGDLVISPAD